MKVNIIGKKSFDSKKSDDVKTYTTFNLTYADDKTDGLACITVFVPQTTYDKYKVGDSIDDVYINYEKHSLCKNI